ncbi:MAG: DinB family protein [Candidatus Limnocylindrales bacterium]
MYRDALDFLEEERAAWTAYEALDGLSDEELVRPSDPTGPAHGWSGRDLIGHMIFWQEHLLAVARELALGDETPTRDRMREAWSARGDAVNEEALATWRAMPLEEMRRQLLEVPGELRGYLTVVPEARWLKHPERMGFVMGQTIDHYEEHRPELEAILGQAGRAARPAP